MIKVSIDPGSARRFKAQMEEFMEVAGKTNKEAMELLAKACAKELAITVPPFGLSAAVGNKFALSIAKQVNRAVNSANIQGISGDAAAVHEAQRNSRGQVPKTLPTRGKFTREPISVRDKETLVDKKQAAAGAAKGAWIAAGEDLNGKKITGVGKWVRRHANRNGDAKVEVKGTGAEVELTNRVPFIDRLQKEDYVNTAIKRGYLRNHRHMVITVKKIRKEI